MTPRDAEQQRRRTEALRGLKKTLHNSFDKARDRGELPGKGSGHKVYFSDDQWKAIHEAIQAMRKTEGDMSEAQALELMAAEYFAGANIQEEKS